MPNRLARASNSIYSWIAAGGQARDLSEELECCVPMTLTLNDPTERGDVQSSGASVIWELECHAKQANDDISLTWWVAVQNLVLTPRGQPWRACPKLS